ncbi:MAG: hypothetical protein V1929_13290 [bacterium]
MIHDHVKTVGRRASDARQGPTDFLRRAEILQRSADQLNPFPKPRGFVFKARTWADYEAWRKAQTNPRLW